MSESKNRADKDRHETVSDEVLENIVGDMRFSIE